MNKTIYLQHYCSDNYDMVNMNTIQKLFICFLFLVLFLPKLPAQDYTVGKSIISLQIGPSRYVGTFLGIADFSKNYRSDLRDGLSWNAGYSYIFGKPGRNCNFGLGLMYQGTRYKHSASDVSDDISMQYLAPQFICTLRENAITFNWPMAPASYGIRMIVVCMENPARWIWTNGLLIFRQAVSTI